MLGAFLPISAEVLSAGLVCLAGLACTGIADARFLARLLDKNRWLPS